MATTYTLIKGETLASSAASYTFSAIPSTYTDLCVKVSLRTNTAGSTQQEFILSVNGATSGTNASQTYVLASSSTISSGRRSGTWRWLNMYAPANSATSNTFGNAEFYFPNYTSSTAKPSSAFVVSENNTSTDLASWIGINANLTQDTSAITSLTFAPNSADSFVAGSSFYLYGIKNS